MEVEVEVRSKWKWFGRIAVDGLYGPPYQYHLLLMQGFCMEYAVLALGFWVQLTFKCKYM